MFLLSEGIFRGWYVDLKVYSMKNVQCPCPSFLWLYLRMTKVFFDQGFSVPAKPTNHRNRQRTHQDSQHFLLPISQGKRKVGKNKASEIQYCSSKTEFKTHPTTTNNYKINSLRNFLCNSEGMWRPPNSLERRTCSKKTQGKGNLSANNKWTLATRKWPKNEQQNAPDRFHTFFACACFRFFPVWFFCSGSHYSQDGKHYWSKKPELTRKHPENALSANSEIPGLVRLKIPKPWKMKEIPSPEEIENFETPTCGRQKGINPICSDFRVFFRFIPICAPCFREFVPICSNLLRFLPIFSEKFWTNQNKSRKLTPFWRPLLQVPENCAAPSTAGTVEPVLKSLTAMGALLTCDLWYLFSWYLAWAPWTSGESRHSKEQHQGFWGTFSRRNPKGDSKRGRPIFGHKLS